MANKKQRDKEKKRTGEKLKALGPLKLTITLTDYLTSPSGRTPVTTYLKSFCQSLEPSTGESPRPLLENEDPDSWTLTNLDSGDIQAMAPPVWNGSNDSGCGMLSDDLSSFQDLSSSDDSLYDLFSDMSTDEWQQDMDDVTEPFDLDAFDLDTFVSLTPDDF